MYNGSNYRSIWTNDAHLFLNSETTTVTPSDLHVKVHAIFNIRACYCCRGLQRLQRGAAGCGFFYDLDTFVSYDSPCNLYVEMIHYRQLCRYVL